MDSDTTDIVEMDGIANQLFFPESRPWVEHGDHIRLVANKCGHCGAVAFPPKGMCHVCGEQEALGHVELSAQGVLYTFSRVHTAPRAFETPYCVGYVDFPEGPRVFGQLAPDAAEIGKEVTAHLATIRNDDGNAVTGFRFRSAAK